MSPFAQTQTPKQSDEDLDPMEDKASWDTAADWDAA